MYSYKSYFRRVYLVFGLNGLQLTIILCHFFGKCLFQSQGFIQFKQLFGQLCLTEGVLSGKVIQGSLGILANFCFLGET